MAPVIQTPVAGFTGTVAGVNFADGVGETDDAAALLYFSGAGYVIGDGKPVVADPEPNGVEDESPADQSEESEESESEHESVDEEHTQDAGAERPHPVQGSKAVWFEYLTGIRPDHGFDLETVSRKDLIAAVEAIEAE